ncbi:hypothetical protein KQX54_008906 [Cotesia glomerata]|uniref:Uncharacterized protein n=1 Tax=Cotesia glomerata TaxID=32391 RepID=A0AAV7I9H3_COTGL|nr:hypothetical protein KQX54_008906 [Cotesia glomerata]
MRGFSPPFTSIPSARYSGGSDHIDRKDTEMEDGDECIIKKGMDIPSLIPDASEGSMQHGDSLYRKRSMPSKSIQDTFYSISSMAI